MPNAMNINIYDGFKEFTINNDSNKVIRFNPSDIGIIERINKAHNEIKDIKIDTNVALNNDGTPVSEIQSAADAVNKLSTTIKRQIDFIFDSPVSDVVFGNQSPISMVGGIPFYERFLNAVIPVIENEVKAEKKASEERISKYTSVVK